MKIFILKKKYKLILLLTFLLVFSLIISSVSASDNLTINNNNGDVNSTIINSTNLNSVTNYNLNENNDNNQNQTYVNGNYSNLNNSIEKNDIVYLNGNVSFNPETEHDNFNRGINLSKNVTIDGNGFTISGSGAVRNFFVSGNTSLTLKNLILTGQTTNVAGSIILFKGAVLNLENVTFTNCSSILGGVIYGIMDDNKVLINNSSFIDCSALNGGSISLTESNLLINNTRFINSQSNSVGGGLFISNSQVKILNSNFINCSSLTSTGGGVYSRDNKLIIINTNFTNCNGSIGGAIAQLSGYLIINDSNFNSNAASYYGGAIYNIYSVLKITNSKFESNIANDGGVLYVDNATGFNIKSSQFINNTATVNGGAIYYYMTNFNDSDNIFTGNIAVNGSNLYKRDYDFIRTISNISQIITCNYTLFNGTIPSAYDLRDYGLVSPVKNQGYSSSCYSFGSYAALESCVLKACNITYDFSENNLKNLVTLYSMYMYGPVLPNMGGIDEMPFAYLTSWLGPVNESMEPFDDFSTVSPVLSNVLNIQNILTLSRNNFTDNNAIKLAMLNYGAIATGIFMDNDYFNNNSYYYVDNKIPNHEVCIVGWDDNYSKNNFLTTPAGDGAWIIKNSYKHQLEDDGYFYVSYYDANCALGNTSSFTFILNDSNNYNKNYQYDLRGKDNWIITNTPSVWYTVEYNSTGDDVLKAFSTYFHKTTDYTAYVYKNNQLVSTQNGYSETGYYTIPLNDNIILHNGDTFKIKLNIKTNSSADIPIVVDNETRSILFENVSYISFDNINWVDLLKYNGTSEFNHTVNGIACLKAFTISLKSTKIVSENLTKNYGETANFTGKLLDNDENPVTNQIIQLNLTRLSTGANKIYNVSTDNDGLFQLPINLAPGNYSIISMFKGNDTYSASNSSLNSVIVTNNIINTILTANYYTGFYGENRNFTGKLTDNKGNPLKNQNISLNLTRLDTGVNKIYEVTTDNNGEYQLPINLWPANYSIQANYKGDKAYAPSSAYATVTVEFKNITYVNGSYTNLQNAVNNSDYILLNGDVILNTNESDNFTYGIEIKGNTIINGQGYTIDALNLVRHFSLKENSSLILKNIILVNAYSNFSASMALFQNSKLSMDNVTIANCNGYTSSAFSTQGNNNIFIKNSNFKNLFSNDTGAIFLIGNGSIINTNFTNITTNGMGAGICVSKGDLNITGSNFNNCTSTKDLSGAVYGEGSNITVNASNFNNCNADIAGAITSLGGKLNIDNSKFTNNSVKYYGGVIYSVYTNLNIYNSIFDHNTAHDGGALCLINTTETTLKNNKFTNNTAINGGVIYTYLNSNLTLKSNYFMDNTATNGSLLYNKPFSVVKTVSNISQNLKYNYTIYNGSLPDYYDLRKLNLITSVKNQKTGGSCWAFSACACLESCLLKITNTTYDLSEENMKNLMNFYGKYGVYNLFPNHGGTIFSQLTYYADWIGPVNDTIDTYNPGSAISVEYDNLYNIQNILTFSRANCTDNDKIKYALMNYGALSTQCFMTLDYFNNITYSYYVPGNFEPNHAITIVGWDDNYSKNNFIVTPPGDGAWIIKNSYGTSFGDSGYMYVSYYDMNAVTVNQTLTFTFLFNDSNEYDKNYAYGSHGVHTFYNTKSNSAWYSALYNSTGNDYLKSFSTYFNVTTNYTAYIYVNNELKYVQNGSSESGYYTIPLNKNIPVNNGDTFEIRLNVRNIEGNTFLPINIYGLTKQNPILYNVTFYSADGVNWEDLVTQVLPLPRVNLSEMYACLNAFTIANENATILIANNYTNLYGAGLNFTGTLLDINGKPINKGDILINLTRLGSWSKTYHVQTDINGQYNLPINLSKGSYTANCSFNGTNLYTYSNANAKISVI